MDEGQSTGIDSLRDRSRGTIVASQARAAEVLERHQHRPVVATSLLMYQRDRAMAGLVVSSALAFRLFLFMVPLLLFVVGIVGFLGDLIDEENLDNVGIGGTLAAQIDSALSQQNATRWLAVFVGLFGVAVTGRSLSRVLVAASCLAWQLPVRTKASLRAVAVIVGLLFGILAAAAIVNRLRLDHGLALAGLSLAGASAVYAVAWLAMSLVLPKSTPDPGSVIPGTVLFAAVLTALQAVSALYVPGKLERASQVYGTIGLVVVSLGWLFIVSRTMVLSMVLNATVHEQFGSVTRFVFSLPGLRWLAARWEWLRRFFDLDD